MGVFINTIRHDPYLHKEIMLLSIQNLKTLDLWIFFLHVVQLTYLYSMCKWTTLGFLTVSPSSAKHF